MYFNKLKLLKLVWKFKFYSSWSYLKVLFRIYNEWKSTHSSSSARWYLLSSVTPSVTWGEVGRYFLSWRIRKWNISDDWKGRLVINRLTEWIIQGQMLGYYCTTHHTDNNNKNWTKKGKYYKGECTCTWSVLNCYTTKFLLFIPACVVFVPYQIPLPIKGHFP